MPLNAAQQIFPLHCKDPEQPMGKGTEFNTGIFICSLFSSLLPSDHVLLQRISATPTKEDMENKPQVCACFLPTSHQVSCFISSLFFIFPLYFWFISFICSLALRVLIAFWVFCFFVDGGIQGLHRDIFCSLGILIAGFLKDFMISSAAGLLYLAGTLPFSFIHLLYCKQNQWNWS